MERVDPSGEPVTQRGAQVGDPARQPARGARHRADVVDVARGVPGLLGEPRAEIVDFLNDFRRPEIEPGRSVLEVGCNAGTNLNRLRELGFHDLTGIEINANALGSAGESKAILSAAKRR